jgi:hypothetical protein
MFSIGWQTKLPSMIRTPTTVSSGQLPSFSTNELANQNNIRFDRSHLAGSQQSQF